MLKQGSAEASQSHAVSLQQFKSVKGTCAMSWSTNCPNCMTIMVAEVEGLSLLCHSALETALKMVNQQGEQLNG